MKFLIVLALLFAVSCAAKKKAQQKVRIGNVVFQDPQVWDALRDLRGGKDYSDEEQTDLINNAVAGQDYPLNVVVPETPNKDCSAYNQIGYYADPTDPSRCQVYYVCDLDGNQFGFLCPNQTLFNQITLVCDWWFNIDCQRSVKYLDYSNSRIGHADAVLLDDQLGSWDASADKAGYASQKVLPMPMDQSDYAPHSRPKAKPVKVASAAQVQSYSNGDEYAPRPNPVRRTPAVQAYSNSDDGAEEVEYQTTRKKIVRKPTTTPYSYIPETEEEMEEQTTKKMKPVAYRPRKVTPPIVESAY